MEHFYTITKTIFMGVVTTLAACYLFVELDIISSTEMYKLWVNHNTASCWVISVLILTTGISIQHSLGKQITPKNARLSFKGKLITYGVAIAITWLTGQSFAIKVQTDYQTRHADFVRDVKSDICNADSPIHAARKLNWIGKTLDVTLMQHSLLILKDITSPKYYISDKDIDIRMAEFNYHILLACDALVMLSANEHS